jgi:hypothetical protein
MHVTSRLLGLAAILALAALLTSSAEAKVKKAPRKHHTLHGVVVSVEHQGKKGTITIRTHHKTSKKKVQKNAIQLANPNARKGKGGHVHTAHVNQHTHFHRAVRTNRGTLTNRPSNFGELKQGDHVAVKIAVGKSHHAQDVHILPKKATK